MTGSDLLVLAFSIALAMAVYARTGLACGGIVTPGLLALQASGPGPVMMTLFWGLLLLPLQEGAVRMAGLYGRQRLAFALLTAALLRGLLLQADLLPGALVAGYGWLLPGLVAADMQRQGVVPTALALTAVTALTILAGGLLP
jgi:predicted membrane-bound spermidine synthase